MITLGTALVFALLVPSAESYEPIDDVRLDEIAKATGFEARAVEEPCRKAGPAGCEVRALDGLRTDLRTSSTVRIGVLGDSHVAADYITSMIRHRLQSCWGEAGRGLVQPDQSLRFGGRRLRRSGFRRERVVEARGVGRAYGLTGNALVSAGPASSSYRVRPTDTWVRLYIESGNAPARVHTGTVSLSLPATPRLVEWRLRPPPGSGRLTVMTKDPGLRVVGLSFERAQAGVQVDAVGPVGAEARVYLQLDRRSFVEHLRLRDYSLVVLLLGGNDAHKIRKGWWTIERVDRQFRRVVTVLQAALPGASCLLVSPMDAGRRVDGRIVGKPAIDEVRDRMRQVAIDHGCGFWDLFEAMGGTGSVARWVRAQAMNSEDLVHPRRSAADLIGRGFARALVEAVTAEDDLACR